MTILNRLGSSAAGIYTNIGHAGAVIKRGVLKRAEQGSQVLNDVYSMEGFEKWTKAAVSDLRLLSLHPSIKGVFDKCLKTLEAQKDFIYATNVFSSTADFVRIKKNGTYTITRWLLPRTDGKKHGKIEWVKFFYGIGNFFETGCFLKKYNVMSFPRMANIANKLGSIKLFSYGGKNVLFGNIPVLNALCNKPKDFFVFLACMYTTTNWLIYDKNRFSLLSLAKLVSNLGKMVLISSAAFMIKNNHFTALAIFDFVASNASLLSTILKRSNGREDRFQNP